MPFANCLPPSAETDLLMRLSLSTVAALLAGLVVAGCSRSDSGKPIDVGHIHAVNHEDAEYKALQLAVEDLNKESDRLPRGRTLVVRHAPGGNKPDEWGAQATRLITLNKSQVLIGGDRGESAQRIGTAVQGENVIAVSPAGWPGTPASQNLFTVGLAPEERGRVLALLAKSAPRGKSAGVLILRDPVAKVANIAANRFAADCRAFAPVSELDVSAAKKPEAGVVFFACSARQAVQSRDAFKDPLLLFGDEEAELPALLAEGPAAEGFHIATAHDPTSQPERLAAFARRYEEMHKQPPTAGAVLTHDSLRVWVEAARRADSLDAAAIRGELLKRETPFEVLTGSLTFADDHTARRPIFVGRVAGGKLADVKSYEAGGAK
jgi:ABC-type branched-subunit amino acid transport system substrate-binding protein